MVDNTGKVIRDRAVHVKGLSCPLGTQDSQGALGITDSSLLFLTVSSSQSAFLRDVCSHLSGDGNCSLFHSAGASPSAPILWVLPKRLV